MTKYKLPLILAITFSAILILSVITLSILQTNTKPNLPNPDEIKIYKQSTSAQSTYKKGSAEYNEIINLYNTMFEKSYLNQLTDKKFLREEISEDQFAPLWSDINKETGLFIEFVFTTPKKYIVYRDNNSRRVDVSSIIFELSKEDSSENIYIYYTTQTEENKSNSDKDKNSQEPAAEPNYPLVTCANTYNLFKYIITTTSK